MPSADFAHGSGTAPGIFPNIDLRLCARIQAQRACVFKPRDAEPLARLPWDSYEPSISPLEGQPQRGCVHGPQHPKSASCRNRAAVKVMATMDGTRLGVRPHEDRTSPGLSRGSANPGLNYGRPLAFNAEAARGWRAMERLMKGVGLCLEVAPANLIRPSPAVICTTSITSPSFTVAASISRGSRAMRTLRLDEPPGNQGLEPADTPTHPLEA